MCCDEIPGTVYDYSETGWMTSEIFENWFTKHFLVYAPPLRPLILLMDGHSTHYGPTFITRAAEEKIIVFCLPPNTTHMTQPLDKGPFSPLKLYWKEECHRYLTDNPGKVVTRYQFSSIFRKAWLKAMTPSNIMGGFKLSGLYPLNRYAVIPKCIQAPSTLCEHTGLRFIPLLSPAAKHHLSLGETTSSTSYAQDDSLVAHQSDFTDEENAIFSKRWENGYDITTDTRYNLWCEVMHGCHNVDGNSSESSDTESLFQKQHLLQSHSSSCQNKHPTFSCHCSTMCHNSCLGCSTISCSSTTLSKVLHNKAPIIKHPDLTKSKSGCIITSNEFRKLLNEKEQKKKEEKERKEAQKIEREKKRIAKEIQKEVDKKRRETQKIERERKKEEDRQRKEEARQKKEDECNKKRAQQKKGVLEEQKDTERYV